MPGNSPHDCLEDAQLVTQAQLGDELAFEQLVQRHADLAYRVALRIMRNPHAAENAAQDAFIRAWRSLPGFRQDATFSTWLYRIVTTTCLTHLRTRRITTQLVEPLTDPDAGPEARALATDTMAAVQHAINRLSPGDRAAFVLQAFEGLSYRDIADSLDITTAAVRSRLRRARRTIAQQLDQETQDA